MKTSDLVLLGGAFLLYSTISEATSAPLLAVNVPSPAAGVGSAVSGIKGAVESFVSGLFGSGPTSLSPVSVGGITYALRESAPGNYSYYTYDPSRWTTATGTPFTSPSSTSISDVSKWAGVPVQQVLGNTSGYYAVL